MTLKDIFPWDDPYSFLFRSYCVSQDVYLFQTTHTDAVVPVLVPKLSLHYDVQPNFKKYSLKAALI